MKNTLKKLNNNLLIETSDTELFKFCQEVLTLGEKFPGIYTMTEEIIAYNIRQFLKKIGTDGAEKSLDALHRSVKEGFSSTVQLT